MLLPGTGGLLGPGSVWELPGVFLYVMPAHPGPPQLRQQHKETSVRLSQLQP